MENLRSGEGVNKMASPVFAAESVVIKEEVIIKEEEPQMYESEREILAADPLFLGTDIKSEPLERMEAVEYGDSFWDESQPGEYADDSNSRGSFLQVEADVSTRTEEQPLYRCKFCPKTYKRLGAFTSHTKTHTVASNDSPQTASRKDTQTLRCPSCVFFFNTYADMLAHHREKHPSAVQQREFLETKAREVGSGVGTSDATFQCGVCFRKLEDLASFFSHRKLHEQSTCEECGKMTTYNSVFHKLTHLGIPLHPCLSCEKSFSQKSTLALHGKLHSNEKSHECDICQEKFVWFYELVNHKKNHSSEANDVLAIINEIKASYFPNGRKCRKCELCFDNVVEYSKHVVSHDVEEERVLTLKCHICDQVFDDVRILLNHIKCHK
ncbi:zinc finger protein 117 [Anabrus simplex]|uniref:zinc finger protein 117 n=1 Tax=Anabrus simplex TaxID=316456 RepID=UPI0035A29615